MLDEFKDRLLDPESEEHSSLLSHVKGLIDISRKTMSGSYSKWDYNDSIFRSEKKPDKEDRSAVAKGKPAKMIVPLTFSQVMTFVSFCVMTTTQNKRFFELEPTGTEDNPLREPMEVILERDLRRNQWTSFLVQFFLDIGRFSLAAAEVCYKEEYRHMRVPKTEEVQGPLGETTTKETFDFERIPTFVGNKVYPISPYRFFPDTRLPLTRYQEGEFCGSEDMFSVSGLKGDGNLFNLDKIPKMTEDAHKQRQQISRIDVLETRAKGNGDGARPTDKSGFVSKGPVVVTKVVFDLIPADFEVDGKKVLGEETFPVRYIAWYANDATIIRFEEAYYLHGQFPYVCAQFLPDQHKTINEGLSDICDQITNLITWLINAHVTSVRSTIDSKFIVDPAGVDVKSLESRSPYIYLKKNASQTGVDRYIKQFQVSDPTGAFMDDSARLKDLLEVVTGFTGNMQGQYASGRRSATESRVVTQGAAARGKTTLGSIWDSAFEPLGRQLIANNRQEMDEDTFVRILGESVATPELWDLFKADAIAIATSEDFFVFDGTLPSEKAFLAQSLQEVLMTMLTNPQVAAAMGYGPEHFRQIFDDIYNLRGVTNSRLPSKASAVPLPTPDPATVVPMPGAATALPV